MKNDDRNYDLDQQRFNYTIFHDGRNYNLDKNRFNYQMKNDEL